MLGQSLWRCLGTREAMDLAAAAAGPLTPRRPDQFYQCTFEIATGMHVFENNNMFYKYQFGFRKKTHYKPCHYYSSGKSIESSGYG